MAHLEDSYLSGTNISFIEGLFGRFLEDPQSVDPSWRELFEKQAREGRPIYVNGHPPEKPPVALDSADSAQSMGLQARVAQTIYAFRLRGHLVAELDPLGRPRPKLEHIADLGMVRDSHFSPEELEQEVDAHDIFDARRVKLKELLTRLRSTYCRHIGVEFMRVQDSQRRRWLLQRMERSENHTPLSPEEQRHIFTKLSYAVTLEKFLHTKYVGAKRFSLEGAESLIPMMDAFLEQAGQLGVQEVVIGMAHRGRLNVLTNVLGKSPDQIFSEFEGPKEPSAFLRRGDVKYHLGFSSDYQTRLGQRIHLSLAFNPSHLEAVNPVVEGRVRAKQDRIWDEERVRGVPLLIHGDAAFPGQGVTQETLNLAGLEGYATGGTVHVVINNQIGFTTNPNEAYSSLYCTAAAQMLDLPVFHVNGDDPEACVHAMRLATEYRQAFHSDVVVDLVCIRRYGHNEADEPAFTQPKMYELIRAHPTVRQLYGDELVQRGLLTPEDSEAIQQKCLAEFQQAFEKARQEKIIDEPSFLQGLWKNWRGGPERSVPDVETNVEAARLSELLLKLCTLPSGFTAHPKIARMLETRASMARGSQPLDWAAAEALAYATLVTEGYPVRLSGQDTERGTFSHRHAAIYDVNTGNKYLPFQNLSPVQASCTILNSPLSEMGCLGFEFGFSLDYPEALVVWEAQYGDFANGAQVVIDQFISAAEEKWRRLSGIALLLPHGYEGQGPEHSSARLERFLQLCAEDNMQVCYPTTASQIFHLLRRQVLRAWRKPLVVMSPKSLLRKAEVASPLEELARGRFERLLWNKPEQPGSVRRLLLCSGKIYYDLAAGLQEAPYPATAIARVEQLYPLPEQRMRELIESLPNLSEIVWVQEEPRNMGAWRFIMPTLEELAELHRLKPRVEVVGRAESASPAAGFHEAHVLEQKQIVDQAIAKR